MDMRREMGFMYRALRIILNVIRQNEEYLSKTIILRLKSIRVSLWKLVDRLIMVERVDGYMRRQFGRLERKMDCVGLRICVIIAQQTDRDIIEDLWEVQFQIKGLAAIFGMLQDVTFRVDKLYEMYYVPPEFM